MSAVTVSVRVQWPCHVHICSSFLAILSVPEKFPTYWNYRLPMVTPAPTLWRIQELAFLASLVSRAMERICIANSNSWSTRESTLEMVTIPLSVRGCWIRGSTVAVTITAGVNWRGCALGWQPCACGRQRNYLHSSLFPILDSCRGHVILQVCCDNAQSTFWTVRPFPSCRL